jgi:carboxyl-terminal processing protease
MKTKLIIAIALTSLFACISHAQTNFSGVGMVLKAEDHAIRIMQVLPNSPALRAHLTPGLLVLKIDDTRTADTNLKDCVDKLRGEAGTKVRLELLDPKKGETNTVELIREPITLPTLPPATR